MYNIYTFFIVALKSIDTSFIKNMKLSIKSWIHVNPSLIFHHLYVESKLVSIPLSISKCKLFIVLLYFLVFISFFDFIFWTLDSKALILLFFLCFNSSWEFALKIYFKRCQFCQWQVTGLKMGSCSSYGLYLYIYIFFSFLNAFVRD